MAGKKALELSIRIAGQLDKSLIAAVEGANGQLGKLTRSMSRIGTMGLAAVTAAAGGIAAAVADCTKEAKNLESAMAPVVRYADGLADANGRISDEIAENGKTFRENYGAMKTYIQDLSTDIPKTTDNLAAMSAALGQSGYDAVRQMETGILRDTAVAATAMDLDDATAGNYMAKWEAAFGTDHAGVMRLMDQINYLGANMPTTAADIAQAVNASASIGQLAGVDPAATAAMSAAMQAMGVDTEKSATSMKNIYTYATRGGAATKAQQRVWQELGFTAEGVASAMQADGVGTLKEIFEAVGNLPDERKLSALSTLFGLRAEEGSAKIAANLPVLEKALALVSRPSLYSGSMEREFTIQAGTSESMDAMTRNAYVALKQSVGDAFLPVQKEWAVSMKGLLNDMRKNTPELQELAGTLAELASRGVSALGSALEKALPHIRNALGYLTENGPQVASVLGKVVAALVAMKVAPGALNLMGGVQGLLFGVSGSTGGTGGAAGGGFYPGAGKKNGGGLLVRIFRGGTAAAQNTQTVFGLGRAAANLPGAGGWNNFKAGLAGTFAAAANLGGLKSSNVNTRSAALHNVTNAVAGVRQNGIFGGLWNAATGLIGKTGLPPVSAGPGAAGVKTKFGLGAIGNVLAPVGKMLAPAGTFLTGALPAAGAIAGVIASLSILKDHLHDIRNFVWDTFGEKGLAVFDSFTEKIQEIADFIYGLFGEGGVANALAPLREKVTGLFGEGAGAPFDAVVQILQSVMNVAGQFVDFSTGTVKPLIEDILRFVTGSVVPKLVQTFTACAPFIAGIIESIGSVFVTGMQIIGTVVRTLWPIVEPVLTLILTAVQVAAPILLAAVDGVCMGISFAVEAVSKVVTAAGNAIRITVSAWKGAFKGLWESLKKIWENIKGIFEGIVSFIKDVFTGNIKGALEEVKKVFSNVFGAIGNIIRIPLDILNGGIAGIKEALGSLMGSDKNTGYAKQDTGQNRTGQNRAAGWQAKIKDIPRYAAGGFTHGMSIAGEAGTEAVISFARSARMQNIGTWAEAGRMLGVGGYEIADAGAPRVTLTDTREAVQEKRQAGAVPGMGAVTFAPTVNIQGSADRAMVDQALREAEARFKTWYEAMVRRQKRVAF